MYEDIQLGELGMETGKTLTWKGSRGTGSSEGQEEADTQGKKTQKYNVMGVQ